MFCERCGCEMDATGTTPRHPNCNTWTCSKCDYERPELGSARLEDGHEDRLAALKAAVVNAAMAWFVSITKNEVANVERRLVILDACAALAKLEGKP